MSRRKTLGVLGGLSAFVQSCSAGIRGTGHYDGVVFFDRWDGCYLFSGVYLMYVSKNVKETLRPYAGRAMEIDAKDVWQPMNPGDGLIRKLAVVREATMPAQSHLPALDGLRLQASVSVQEERASANIEIENTNAAPTSIIARDLGFAVFTNAHPFIFPPIPTDSRSFALITRANVGLGGGTEKIGNMHWGWRTHEFPRTAPLALGDRALASIKMQLPHGQYQFLAGYGGGVHEGPCVASNAVSFEIG